MTKKLTSLRAKPLAQEYAEAAVYQNAERDALEWVEQEVGASLEDEDSVAGRAIRRGEVWWIALDPSVGGEIRKTRPAVVISNDDANTHHNRIQVMPLTGRTTPARSWEAQVVIESNSGKALADQISTVAKECLLQRMARVTAAELVAIERAIEVQLGLG